MDISERKNIAFFNHRHSFKVKTLLLSTEFFQSENICMHKGLQKQHLKRVTNIYFM